MFHVVSQLVVNKRFLKLIALYLDLDIDLQMQIRDLVSHFHLYHTTSTLALNGDLRRQNDRKIRIRSK